MPAYLVMKAFDTSLVYPTIDIILFFNFCLKKAFFNLKIVN